MKQKMVLCLSMAAFSACALRADVELTSGCTALRLSEAAVPISLVLTADGTECLNPSYREPLAEVQTFDSVWHPAVSLRRDGKDLVLGFSDTDATLTLAVESRPEWIALRVVSFGGTRPQAVRFVKLDSAFTETVGKRLNIGWNNVHALCVMATSPLTDTHVAGQTSVGLEETVAAVKRGEGGVNPRVCLTARTQDAAGTKMEGASAAIIACPAPAFKGVARNVSHAYGLLTNETADGTPVKETELVRGSYLFIDAGLGDADRLIRTCEAAGIRQVLLPSQSWCSSAGTYAINTNAFPNGLEDLKAFVARLKTAGLTVGLHTFAPQTPRTGRDASSAASDEACRRLAAVFNACGFGMVYFDGAENASPRPPKRDLAEFEDHAMRLFNRPVIHMGAVVPPSLWHSFARGATTDTYLNTIGEAAAADRPPAKWPSVKRHIDASVAYMLSLRGDMMPGELGWFGVWPRQERYGREVEGLQLDEIEYLLCRSIAYDCPVSLQTSFRELDRHPLASEILRLFKTYETARLAHRFTEADQAPLREPGKEFTLLRRQGLPPVLVPVQPVVCGNSRDTRAMVGAFEGGSIATFWNAVGKSTVTLDLSPFVLRVANFDDQRVVVQKTADGKPVLPVTTQRLTLYCPTLSAAALEQKIKNSLSINTPRGL